MVMIRVRVRVRVRVRARVNVPAITSTVPSRLVRVLDDSDCTAASVCGTAMVQTVMTATPAREMLPQQGSDVTAM